MTKDYAYDHAWREERIRLAGLEAALDPGTRAHLIRLGVGRGTRCLEVGAGGGSVAFWLAEQVAPGGTVVATDLETDFLESEATRHPCLEVLRHDIMADALPTGFDLVHARWLVEWLPDKRLALQRMAAALRPGGVLLIEEPDFVTIFGAAEPEALRTVVSAAMRYLEQTSSVEVEYGRRALGDLTAVGLRNVESRGPLPNRPGRRPPRGSVPPPYAREVAEAGPGGGTGYGGRVQHGRYRTPGSGRHRGRADDGCRVGMARLAHSLTHSIRGASWVVQSSGSDLRAPADSTSLNIQRGDAPRGRAATE